MLILHTTNYREFKVPGRFSKEENARVAGDPLAHDMVVLFGNESNHWYAIILDNRIGQKKVNVVMMTNNSKSGLIQQL